MGKLKALPARLSTLKPYRVQQAQGRKEYDQYRNQQDWRKWYKTARWQRLRWATLLRDMFTCRLCGKIEADTSKLIADHRDPHRGNEHMFWSLQNLQCLCAPCHSSIKQKMENRGG